ncbi:MAG: DUF11 domain-containing protein [Solirubrobacterales bacterium]|nr:DUF11 domain-containing protein [Solirubrobacterales bacterium]
MAFAMGAMGFVSVSAASADGTIVAMKGGDRSASNSVSGATNYATGVSGATFEYTTGDPTQPATTWTAFPAATNASGLASVSVPAGTYYVREAGAGPGFTNFGPVRTLSYNGSQPYVARVTVQNNQTTYAFPHSNTNSSPSSWTPTNSGSASNNGSPFINVRDNADLPNGCGMNILLVLDRSGSIDPYKDEYEAAAKEFVSQLNGTPTQIGIISFNDSVNSYQPSQGNASFYHSPLSLANAGSAATLNTTIENVYDNPDSLTNWDGVLQAAAQSKSFTPDATTGQTANPDMVVFITDGNPTTSEASTSSSNEDLINLTSGMASANLVKNQASRPGAKVKLMAIGVGTGVTLNNLKAVSGPDEGVDGDYAAPTIPELGDFLSELAASQCGARVYVRKQVTGQSGNQSGWFYTGVDSRPGKTPTYLDGNRATHSSGNPPVIETGAFFSQLPSTPTTVNVNEDAAGQPISNFSLTNVDCRYDAYDGSNHVQGGVQNGLQYSLPVNRGDAIYCTYTNTPKTTLSVSKTPDNQVVNAGDDAEFTIQVTNTGGNTATGVTLSDALPAPGVGGWTISQQPAGNPCQINAGTLSCSFGNLNAGQSTSVKVKTGTSYAQCGTYDNPAAQAGATNANTVSDGGKITCQKPNLSITKTGNGPIDAGQDASFTVTVANAGPGMAKSVTLADPLPGGTAGAWTISSQPAGNPCQIVGGNLNCSFGNLNSGQQAQVTVKAPTGNTACTVYNNHATASSTNAPDVSADASVTCRKPSLGTLKTAVQASISAGDMAQYEITVSNAGPGTATGVTLSDPLPTGVAGPWQIISQPAGNPCSIAGGTLTCNFGDLAAGGSKTVKVGAPTDFADCATLVNTATASATNSPSSSDDATIQCNKPNLTVQKQGGGTVSAGSPVSFTINVGNGGPGIARTVTLDDPLPTGTAGAWAITSQPAGNPCQITAGHLQCAFGDLGAGENRTVAIQAATDFEHCAKYDNTATASSGNAPDATGMASAECQKPGLDVTKSGNGPINAGEDASFTVAVSNPGPGTAKSVKLSDPLPTGTAGAWTISSQPAGNPCQINGNQLDCDFGDMAGGTSNTVTVKAPTSAADCVKYDNTATGSADNAPDDQASASVQCLKPDLSISKSGNGPIDSGDNAEFGLTVSNGGPGVAKSVKLSDPLPSGTAGSWTITSQPAGNPCAIVADQLQCDYGDLAAGESRTVTISAATSYEQCASYDNTGTVAADNSASDQSEATVDCEKPDLKLTKTGNGPVNAGDDIEFTLDVSNGGPGDAKSVTLNDPLPTGVAGSWAISSQPGGNPCSIASDTLSCDFGDMAAGASAQVKVKAPTSHDACKLFENTATATGTGLPEIDADASVSCLKPELGLLKTAVQGTISAGDKAAFSITVSNTGEGVAKGVELDDPLPQNVGSWSITSQPAGNPCQITGGHLQCQFGDMQPGASAVVKVEATVDFDQCATMVNVATASADNSPSADGQATINCQKPSLTLSKSGNGPVNAGSDVQFQLTMSNGGPGVGKAVVMTDTLPSGTAGPWQIVSQPAGNPCTIQAGKLTCQFGDMAAQSQKTVTVKAPTDAADCGTYDNTATFTASNAPTGEDSATVACQKPGLTVTKTGNGPIDAGQKVVFDITAANSGPGTAEGVKITDPLPGGTASAWEIVSQPKGATCAIADRTLNCDLGDMATGATATIRVSADTNKNRCTKYDNEVTETADNAETISATATVGCVKPPEPKLRLKKTADKRKAFPGELVKYKIWVRNAQKGSVATNVKVCDRIPSHMTIAGRNQNNSFFENGKLCWTIKRLPYSKGWRTFNYVARVDQDVRAGERLRNVVILGRLRAHWTVVVRAPEVSPARRVTPVTG